jgi:hypothetical protein
MIRCNNLINASAIFFTLTLLVFEASLAASRQAKTGVSFEPVVGYSTGLLTQTGVADISTQTVNVEARLGYSIKSFEFGLGYLMGFGTGTQFSNKGDFKPIDMSLYLGYDLPWDLKLFGGYTFTSKAKIQSSDNPGDFSGTGTRLGIAYTRLPRVNIMAESVSRSYTKYDGTSFTNPIKDSTVALSVSYQFN